MQEQRMFRIFKLIYFFDNRLRWTFPGKCDDRFRENLIEKLDCNSH